MDNRLNKLRTKIDLLDGKLLDILSKRTQVVREIGQIKKEKKLASLDKKRWKEVLESNVKKAADLGLSKDFITKIFNLIHKYSRIEQEKI